MDTFPPPAPIPAPPLQSHSPPIPMVNPVFAPPTIFHNVPIDTQAEVQNNIGHSAANPTPNLTAPLAPSPHHPSYADMISSAIEALKERDGSSKRAIAKFIEQSYMSLPSNHSALLSYHLKKLKSSGHLVMVKKSYKLPKPDSAAQSAAPSAMQTQTAPPLGTPRGRGRPPKPKPDPNAQPAVQPILQPIYPNSDHPILQNPDQPIPQPFLQPIGQTFPQPSVQFNGQTTAPEAAQFNGQPTAQPNPQAQPVFVALGLADEPSAPAEVAKKRPGRPRKIMAVGGVGGVPSQGGAPGFAKKRRGRPPGSKAKLVGTRLSKKGPGRPRKPKSVLGPSGPKRGPGRPSKAEPKTMIIPYATTANVPIVGVVDQNSIPGVLAVTPRSRGRPRKNSGVAGSYFASGKRRGRPPKLSGGVNKLRSSTGRSVGRPRKIQHTAPSHPGASDALIAANGDLKRKLDFFQTKVKQAVGMLKPELTHDSSANAIAAVQELEELAVIDLNAPLRDEAVQQQPPPPPPPTVVVPA